MELDEEDIASESPAKKESAARPRPIKIVLNAVVLLLLVALGYLSYAYVPRGAVAPMVEKEQPRIPPRTIQLDVLNGCGARGVAARFTSFLRTAGFDVVEMKNYKVSAVP